MQSPIFYVLFQLGFIFSFYQLYSYPSLDSSGLDDIQTYVLVLVHVCHFNKTIACGVKYVSMSSTAAELKMSTSISVVYDSQTRICDVSAARKQQQ